MFENFRYFSSDNNADFLVSKKFSCTAPSPESCICQYEIGRFELMLTTEAREYLGGKLITNGSTSTDSGNPHLSSMSRLYFKVIRKY